MSKDYSFLDDLKLCELKEITKELGIDVSNFKKNDIISLLKNGFKKYNLGEKFEEKKSDSNYVGNYLILDKVGYKSKEGEVYTVKKKGGKKIMIMKKFKKDKSIKNIEKEANFLKRAGEEGLSPKFIDIDLENKFIIMEKMDKSLFDILKENKGKISKKFQERMIEIFKRLDQIGIFHGDPSPLNFIEKDGELYIIDFGFSSEIDSKSIKKNGTDKPNITFMIIGYLLKIKNMCDISVYKEFFKYLSNEDKNLLK